MHLRWNTCFVHFATLNNFDCEDACPDGISLRGMFALNVWACVCVCVYWSGPQTAARQFNGFFSDFDKINLRQTFWHRNASQFVLI